MKDENNDHTCPTCGHHQAQCSGSGLCAREPEAIRVPKVSVEVARRRHEKLCEAIRRREDRIRRLSELNRRDAERAAPYQIILFAEKHATTNRGQPR